MESVGARGKRSVKVRAYGEMVDVLWQNANQSAAIALEEMWTDLGAVYPFDLLCGYAMAAIVAGPDLRASVRSAASIRTARSPRRRTEARTRPGRSATSAHARHPRDSRAIWPPRSRAASRSRQPCASLCGS